MNTWRALLAQNLRPNNHLRRTVILGIGNELNGDDAAGVVVVRSLRAQLMSPLNSLLIEAGVAPENFTGKLRTYLPEFVLLVDAADFDGQPGQIEYIDWQNADGLSATTHTLPPSVLAEFLISELNCQVGVIGIQPASLDFDIPLSVPVRQAVAEVASTLAALLAE